MRGVNKVILIGNATRDADLRHTQTGKVVSSIRLATNRTIKGEEGKERRICEIVADDVQFPMPTTEQEPRPPSYPDLLRAYDRAWHAWEHDPSPRTYAVLQTDIEILYR